MTRDEHEAQVRAVAFWTPRQLATRWGCHVSTVYGLPRTELPFVQLGTGTRRTHRRYNPDDVTAFEARGGVGQRGAAA
jgi:hypothetical protein